MHTIIIIIIVISEIRESGFQSAIPVVIKLYPFYCSKLKIVIHSCFKTIESFCCFHSGKIKRIRTASEELQGRMKKTSKTAYCLKLCGHVYSIRATRIYHLIRLTYRKANLVLEIHSLHLLIQPLLQKCLLADRGLGQSNKPMEITEVCRSLLQPWKHSLVTIVIYNNS